MSSHRRTLLTRLGGVIAGGGALLGTSAFSTVDAARTVAVETAGDANAFLGIEPGAEGDAYVLENGTIEIDLTATEDGRHGVSKHAVTAVDRLLEITNNGPTEIAVGFNDEYALEHGDYDEPPGGWGYTVNTDETAVVVGWASPLPSEMDHSLAAVRPRLVTTGFDRSTLVDGRLKDEVDAKTERTIRPGDRLNIGVLVDTRASTVTENPIPESLDETLSLYAESTTQ
ncbi:hypothetical protein [Natrinema altunense]|uniref:DUF1102 domain-containing protein n=1 Tax=Natrinema altunense TaxID=222984 RepID=A0A482Y8V3_9EURY|nr:hypothetical protein [Natrinema altunense]RZH69217.1 hypothetical protein ELS17_07165 [Natrinema altunense]